MNATINFPFYDSAKAFAREWSFFARRGHTVSAKNKDGGGSVILDNVSETEKVWIDNKISQLNK